MVRASSGDAAASRAGLAGVDVLFMVSAAESPTRRQEHRSFIRAAAESGVQHILRSLSTGDKPVQELAEAMPISRPAVSRHLRLLKDAGLVDERAEGTRRIYRLHDDGVREVDAYLAEIWGTAAARFRLLAENTAASIS